MKIGIIGTGIIASSIVTGFCTKKAGHEFFLSPRNAEKAAALASEFSEVTVCKSNQEVLDSAEWIFISLLPKDYFGAVSELKFRSNHKVVNMSAGMKLPDVHSTIGETAVLAHVVPLPFIRLGIGPILIYPEIAEVGALFAPVGDIFYAKSPENVHIFQVVTGLMSAYNALLHEISMFSEENGIEHDVSVKYMCSMFNAMCVRAASIPDVDLNELAHEMTPGGLNEQALNELSDSGALSAWRASLDRLLIRIRG